MLTHARGADAARMWAAPATARLDSQQTWADLEARGDVRVAVNPAAPP